MFTTTVTQKGQVTIPVSLRELLGIKPRQKVMVLPQNDGVVIKPAVDFSSLRGSIKTNKGLPTKKQTNEAIGKYLAKRHKRIMSYG